MKNYLVLLAFSLAGCNLKPKDNADLARNKLRQAADISATIEEINPLELQYSSFGLSKVTVKVSNPSKHSVKITLSSLPLGLITTDSCRSNRETIWCVFNLQGSFSGFRVAVASVEDYSTGSTHQKSFTLTQSDIGYVQFGTNNDDFTDFSLVAASTSIKLDESNNIYVAGQTNGTYFLRRNFGKRDVFLSKYDEYSNQIWLRQFGTSGRDAINSVAIDQLGNIYVGGWTDGAFPSYTNAGFDDLFLAKYDKDGNQLWLRQVGTDTWDRVVNLAVDSSNNVYFIGNTNGKLDDFGNFGSTDVIFGKYDSLGNQLWLKQLGTDTDDDAGSLGLDKLGNIYLYGSTFGAFSGYINSGISDLFLTKYDVNGNQIWLKQFGTSKYDEASSIFVGKDGDLYINGLEVNTVGMPILTETFITSYDKDGNRKWKKTYQDDALEGQIILDDANNIYVSGIVYKALPGNKYLGNGDAVVLAYDNNGNFKWAKQFGTTQLDYLGGLSISKSGDLYGAGMTNGSLPGYVNPSEGTFSISFDVFIAKIKPPMPIIPIP